MNRGLQSIFGFIASNITNASLRGTNLQYANLENSNLSFSDVNSLLFRDATQFTDLSNANLQGANLEGVHLETVILQGAVMPDGSIHE